MNRMAAHRMMLFGTPSRPAITVAQFTRRTSLFRGRSSYETYAVTVPPADPCPPGTLAPKIAWADRDTYNRFAASTRRALLPEPVEAPAEQDAV